MLIIILTLVSFVARLPSTLAGGGSPFVLIPLVNFILGPAEVPPVITTGILLSNGQRIFGHGTYCPPVLAKPLSPAW